MTAKFNTIYESIMGENPDDMTLEELDREPIEMIESHMAKVNLNLSQAGEIAAAAASPGVTKRAGELGKVIQNQLHDFMDNFGGTSEEDAESRMDANINFITKKIGERAEEAKESINAIYGLVEDRGQEMLDKQAYEKLGDIIELASNLHNELKLRLD